MAVSSWANLICPAGIDTESIFCRRKGASAWETSTWGCSFTGWSLGITAQEVGMEEAEAVSWDPEPGIVFTDREVAPGVDPPHPTQVFIHSHPKHCCSYCCPPGTKKKGLDEGESCTRCMDQGWGQDQERGWFHLAGPRKGSQRRWPKGWTLNTGSEHH